MRTFGILAAMFCLFGCRACSEFAAGFESGYAEGFIREYKAAFVPSCVDTAVSEGAPRDYAQTQCTCLADQLTVQNDVDALMEASSDPGPVFEAMLDRAAAACDAAGGAPSPETAPAR